MEEQGSSELLPQAVQTGISTEVKDLFFSGISFYKAGDIDSSISAFQNIININPQIIEAHINLGNSYFKQNNTNKAIECWKKALSIDSKQESCYVNIGNAYYANGNIEEAINYWVIATTIAPDNSRALLNLGAAYEKLNNISSSLRYYEYFLRYCEDTNSSEFKRVNHKINYMKQVALHNYKAGLKAQKREKYRISTLAYLKAIQAYPNLVKAQLNLGSICYITKNFAHAAKHWTIALKLDHSFIDTYCNLGIVYDRLKQYDKAYCMYSKYLKMSHIKGSTEATLKDRMDKIKVYLDKHPEIFNAVLTQAEEFYKKCRYDDALWEYENYIILKPDQAVTYEVRIKEIKNIINPVKQVAKQAFELAGNYFKEQEFENALQAYKRYIHLEPAGEFIEVAYKRALECSKLMSKNKGNHLAANKN